MPRTLPWLALCLLAAAPAHALVIEPFDPIDEPSTLTNAHKEYASPGSLGGVFAISHTRSAAPTFTADATGHTFGRDGAWGVAYVWDGLPDGTASLAGGALGHDFAGLSFYELQVTGLRGDVDMQLIAFNGGAVWHDGTHALSNGVNRIPLLLGPDTIPDSILLNFVVLGGSGTTFSLTNLAAVPEPTTPALLAFAAGMLAHRKRALLRLVNPK